MYKKIMVLDLRDQMPEKTKEELGEIAEEVVYTSRQDADILDKVKDVEALIDRFQVQVDRELIEAAENLKIVSVVATDYSFIDMEAAKEHGVAVANVGGYSTEAVAEFVVAAVLENARQLNKGLAQAATGDYSSLMPFFGTELKGKKLGVIGAGRIGSRILELFTGFDMGLSYYSRSEKAKLIKIGAKLDSVENIAMNCDYVVISVALNNDTTNIMSADMIKSMKSDTTLVNIAPVEVIDNEALVERAEKGELTAIIDHVKGLKPNTLERYDKCDKVTIYPPIGFKTHQSEQARWDTTVSNIKNFSEGSPQNIVE